MNDIPVGEEPLQSGLSTTQGIIDYWRNLWALILGVELASHLLFDTPMIRGALDEAEQRYPNGCRAHIPVIVPGGLLQLHGDPGQDILGRCAAAVAHQLAVVLGRAFGNSVILCGHGINEFARPDFVVPFRLPREPLYYHRQGYVFWTRFAVAGVDRRVDILHNLPPFRCRGSNSRVSLRGIEAPMSLVERLVLELYCTLTTGSDWWREVLDAYSLTKCMGGPSLPAIVQEDAWEMIFSQGVFGESHPSIHRDIVRRDLLIDTVDTRLPVYQGPLLFGDDPNLPPAYPHAIRIVYRNHAPDDEPDLFIDPNDQPPPPLPPHVAMVTGR